MNFWKNLLKLEQDPAKGEVLYFKLFELFIIAFVIHFAWEWGFYIQRIGEVVLPLGIAQYIDISFMFDNGISLVNAALMTLFVLLGFFRVLPRYSYMIAFLCFHLHYVSRYSLGEISHGSNIIGMSLLAVALSLFFFKDPKIYRHFAIGFVLFFVGLGYTSAGVSKLIGTGLTWPDGNHLWLWMAERKVDVLSEGGVFSYNWIQEFSLKYRWFATLSLTFGLVAELAGFLLWFDKTRPFIAAALIVMHLGVYVTMNIMFDVYIYVLLLIGFPWSYWFDHCINFEKNPLLYNGYKWSTKLS